MKIKVAIASVAVVAVAVVAFSFTTKKATKPTSVTYNYVSSTPYQRMLWNTNPLSLVQKSIDKDANTPPYFKRATSWTTNTVSFSSTNDYTQFIGAISFDEEATADGGGNGLLTLQEAIDALYSNYISTQAMPSSLTVGSAVINVTAATAAH
jgi:hypothetical protein